MHRPDRDSMTARAARPRPLRVLFLNWRDHGPPRGRRLRALLESVAAQLAGPGPRRHRVHRAHPGARRGRGRSTASGSCAAAAGSASTRTALLQLLRHRRPRTTSWSTCRTACRSGQPPGHPPPGGRPGAPRAPRAVAGGRSGRSGPGSAGGSSPGWRRGSTAARRYVVVSQATRDELVGLGVDRGPDRRSSTTAPSRPLAPARPRARTSPSLVVLGRLVPHKRVELALRGRRRAARAAPRPAAHVVGHGYWHDELRADAARLGVERRGALPRASSTTSASTACWPRPG